MPVASSSVAAPLRLRLLGAGSVWLEDRNLTFATRKMSAVLVYLALEGSVTRSKLAGLLWSDNAEDEARRNLRRELHRLRNAGLRAHFDGQGDVLHLRGFTCDALELDAALREGDSARASKLCQGELLEDVQLENADGFLSWLEDQRGRYRQMTVRALTLESERLETRGDWRGALGLQERLLHSNALQERTYRDLMRLHAQLGERERSLEVYARLQRILRDELGLEPLPETVRLAQGIRGAPSALGSEEGFTPSPRQFVPFVGRETVSRQLEASSGVVLVTGEPGVGKTRLVLEMNPAAVTVRFTEIGARTPLYAIAEILRLSWSDSMQRERLQALEPAWKRDLARVLPEVDETAKLEAIPDAPGRARFLESLARALRTLGTFVLEDVHWADAMSVQVLHHLTRQPMPLIVTARAEELAGNHAATLWLNELEASNTLTRLNLEPLNEKALAELSASFVTDDPDGLAARLYRSTRGNPLFAIETLRFALERGSTDALTLPPNLREAVLGRVKRLGGAVWRLLETASLAERGFRLEEVQSATALSEWEALEGLERAVGAGLLERIDLGLAFHHDLIRQALEDNLSPERRALIHRKLAETLEHQEAAPERVAHHLERAGLGAQAAIWRVRAARAAALLYAHREALEQYELALHHEVSADMRFEIVEATILLHYALGQAAQRQAAVEQLEQLGTRPEWRARALVARVMLEYDLGRYAQALKRAESLVEAEPSADQLEALLLYGSIARMRLGELDDAEAGLERGLNLAVQHRSKRINEFHLYRATVATYQGRYEDARRFNDAILRGEHTGDWVELDAVVNQGRFAVMLGDFEHGERCLRTALERARALQSDSMIRFALLGLSGTLNIRWAWREALPLVLENLELARQAQHKIVEIVMLDRLAQTRRLQGDLGAAFDALHLARAETAAAQASGSRAMIALSFAGLYLDVGDAARAQVELRDARSRAERENAVPYFAPIWTGLARAAWLEGDSVEAQECSVKARAFWDRSPASDRLESEHWWQLIHAVPISSVENLSWLPWRIRASMIALRTRGDAESTQNALGLLETSDLPPLEELELRRALRDLAPEVASATSFRARTRQIVQRLASSLESHPAHRKRFLTRHAGWLRD